MVSMKLAPREFDGFLRGPMHQAAALFHGSDAGQVRQYAMQAIQHWIGPKADGLAQCELTTEKLKEEPTLLSDELAAMSLMAPRRAIIVREVEDAHLPAIQDALATRAPENFLVLYTTESLPSTSKLRVWGERAADVATFALYKDEGAGLEQFIRDTLRGYGLRANSEVTRYLATQLSGDRQIIVNELEKLSLYVGDEVEDVTLDDVLAAVGENNDQSFDNLNNAVAVGDMVALCRLSDRLLIEGNPGLLLVRSLMRYFARLETIALKRREGMSIDAAIEGLRPPVFFKAKPLLKAHASRWDAEACATALARLQLLELDSKRYADESLSRMAHGFMEIAGLATSQKRAA
jgi:DNA polymerase-3 subunit delta